MEIGNRELIRNNKGIADDRIMSGWETAGNTAGSNQTQ